MIECKQLSETVHQHICNMVNICLRKQIHQYQTCQQCQQLSTDVNKGFFGNSSNINHVGKNSRILDFLKYRTSTLNPILPGGGIMAPLSYIHWLLPCGQGFTKFHDFVPFGIYHDPVQLLLTLFIKNMKNQYQAKMEKSFF